LNVRVIWFEEGEVVKGIVVWKALAGAALMAKETAPTPKAARAFKDLEPEAADWADSDFDGKR